MQFFFRNRQREKEKEELLGELSKMDKFFYERDWRVFSVDPHLASAFGAFIEDAVSEGDFYEPQREAFEDIFYRKEE